MKKLAALLFLLSAVLAQGLTFDQTWRVDLSPKQTKELRWFQGQSITLNLASTTNGGRYNLSGTNVVVIWQGVAATNTEQTWFVVTGTVANATNGQSTYELIPEQSNLLPDFYYGFVQALRVEGTNLVFMDVLGMQSIEVLYNPDVRYTGYHGPLSYDLAAITVLSNYVDTLLSGTNTALKTGTTFYGPTTNMVDAFFKSNVSARTISLGDPGSETNITPAKMSSWDGDRNGAAVSNVVWVSLDSPADPPMSKGWTNDIQAAINSCPPGGSVLIAPGEYALTAGLVVTTKVTISGLGRDATIIRGGGSGSNYRGFTFSGAGMTSVVEDLTITGFRGVLHGAGAYYGVFNRCNFINNSSTWGFVEGGGEGGAAHSAVLNDCLISGNYAQKGGGGLRTCVARNCVISNNVTAYTGGGAYGGTLDECIVQNNYGANGGGGCDRVDLFRCTILDNALGSGNNGTNLWDAWMEDCWVEEGVETLVEVGWTNCVIAGVLWFDTENNYTNIRSSVVVGGGVTTTTVGNTTSYILGTYLTPAGGTVAALQVNSNIVINEGGTAWYLGGAPGQFFISAEGDFAEDDKGPPFLVLDSTNGSLHLLGAGANYYGGAAGLYGFSTHELNSATSFVRKVGDQMSGPLILPPITPTNAFDYTFVTGTNLVITRAMGPDIRFEPTNNYQIGVSSSYTGKVGRCRVEIPSNSYSVVWTPNISSESTNIGTATRPLSVIMLDKSSSETNWDPYRLK